MTDRLDDAKALIRKSEEQLKQLEGEYRASLSKKEISQELKIDIKNILENLRSALDYSASYIYRACCSPKGSPNIYFPIAANGADVKDFSSLANKNIPGLLGARPDIIQTLASFQQFSSKENDWLPELATLCNENKHEQLTPQQRKEVKQLRIKSGGVEAAIGEGARIHIGQGAGIQLGKLFIPGGQEISADKAPFAIGNGNIEKITWVSFVFSVTGKNVIDFLRTSIAGVNNILSQIEKIKV